MRGILNVIPSLFLLVLISPHASAQGPTITGKRVGTFQTYVPSAPEFVLHGTMPTDKAPFQRSACPYVVVDPDGRPLVTQWELVLVAHDFMVVELLANVVNTGGWTGKTSFDVYEGTSPFDFSAFDPQTVASLLQPHSIALRLVDQNGASTRRSLTGSLGGTRFLRYGPSAITVERNLTGPYGGVQTWMTVRAYKPEVELIVNWHNGALPAQPDIYFDSLFLEVGSGKRWTPLLPDPAMAYPKLVKPDDHILPQRWQRPFRVVIHPDGTTPDLSLRGWAVSDWSQGKYQVQSIALPDLSHTTIDLTPQKIDDYLRLGNNWPTAIGNPPVSFLWPAQGVYYGGMTSGHHIEPIPAVPLAVSGQTNGLLSLYVEQLRYGARHMGCIYEANGEPINQDAYLNPDGSQPWDLFNNVFIGYPPKDAPFFFSQTGPGVGQASYDPTIFEPIDLQHYIRRTKANKALLWLDNDPLARLYVRMDAELGRMTVYEGPGGRLKVPGTSGLGVVYGRGEAWVADVMATAWTIGDTAWRNRNRAWFETFREALEVGEMANRLFSALSTGKMATTPPYGNGTTAYYWVHRSDEQIFMMHALRGLQETVGMDCNSLIKKCGEGIWNFAWKVGTDGVLDLYPAGPIVGARYSNRSQIPPGLTSTVPDDPFHVALACAYGEEAGANMVPALLAHTGASNIQGALAVFESWGIDNIENRAGCLSKLQSLFP